MWVRERCWWRHSSGRCRRAGNRSTWRARSAPKSCGRRRRGREARPSTPGAGKRSRAPSGSGRRSRHDSASSSSSTGPPRSKAMGTCLSFCPPWTCRCRSRRVWLVDDLGVVSDRLSVVHLADDACADQHDERARLRAPAGRRPRRARVPRRRGLLARGKRDRNRLPARHRAAAARAPSPVRIRPAPPNTRLARWPASRCAPA